MGTNIKKMAHKGVVYDLGGGETPQELLMTEKGVHMYMKKVAPKLALVSISSDSNSFAEERKDSEYGIYEIQFKVNNLFSFANDITIKRYNDENEMYSINIYSNRDNPILGNKVYIGLYKGADISETFICELE